METNDLYAFADAHQHTVISAKLRESPSFCIDDQNQCYIVMDSSLSGSEEKTNLAHELGHCEYGGFYNYHSPFALRSKVECRANRWAFLHVLPISEIQSAIDSGCSSIWELAEYFSVTENFMKKALLFYTEQLQQRFQFPNS